MAWEAGRPAKGFISPFGCSRAVYLIFEISNNRVWVAKPRNSNPLPSIEQLLQKGNVIVFLGSSNGETAFLQLDYFLCLIPARSNSSYCKLNLNLEVTKLFAI